MLKAAVGNGQQWSDEEEDYAHGEVDSRRSETQDRSETHDRSEEEEAEEEEEEDTRPNELSELLDEFGLGMMYDDVKESAGEPTNEAVALVDVCVC
jgi:hypothetical protein